jgi:predicted transcriptional regulator
VKKTPLTKDEKEFEARLKYMLDAGWLIENADGTFTVTDKGLKAADQYKALKESTGEKQ